MGSRDVFNNFMLMTVGQDESPLTFLLFPLEIVDPLAFGVRNVTRFASHEGRQ